MRGGFLQKASSMLEESLDALVCLSTDRALINATDARCLATKRSSVISLRSVGDALKRAIITAIATNPCLSVSYAKAYMNRLAETARSSTPPNISNTFRMMQLNMRKQGPVHDSLKNDEEIQEATVLVIQEPYARRIQSRLPTNPIVRNKWSKMVPSTWREGRWAIRSML